MYKHYWLFLGGKIDRSKFWQLDKRQHFSGTQEATSPLPKEPFLYHWQKGCMTVVHISISKHTLAPGTLGSISPCCTFQGLQANWIFSPALPYSISSHGALSCSLCLSLSVSVFLSVFFPSFCLSFFLTANEVYGLFLRFLKNCSFTVREEAKPETKLLQDLQQGLLLS